MIIVDAHLDLAYNVTRGRDPRRPAREQPVADKEIATVGLPDLRAGGVGLICATIFCAPAGYGDRDGYTTAAEAYAQAQRQLAWYRGVIDAGLMRLVRSREELPDRPRSIAPTRGMGASPMHPSLGGFAHHERQEPLAHRRGAHATEDGATADNAIPAAAALPAILLLEGADAMRSPADVDEFFAAGVRIVGLAWRQTRMCGGTGCPGPITDEGRALIKEFDRVGIIHDASHLAEESFYQLLDLTAGPMIASHSNCRAIVGE